MKLIGVREKVFLDRYSLKDEKGDPIEKTPEEMWRRVSKAIAAVEKQHKKKFWEDRFYSAMEDFKFVPGGRVLAGAGTGYGVTFYNCFVIPSPSDSRDGIMDNLKNMIEIMARGGGVGVNISSLRPRGARVKKVNGFSSGPINWAAMYSLATHDIIQQGGCFASDTKIMTHLGLIPIKDIVDNKSNYYAATHQGYKKVSTKFNNGVKDVYEVTTAAGFTVKTTLAHRFLTFDKNGKFSLKTLADFKEGEDIVHLLGEWSDELPYVILNTNLPAPSKHSFGLKNIVLPRVLNEDLAFIVGAYDADGTKIPDKFSVNGKGISIAIANDRPEDLQRLITAITRCFNRVPKLRKGDGAVTRLELYSRIPNEFLKLNGLLKDYSVTVRVPEKIFTSPKSVVEAYIAGVFLGDGTNRGGKGGLRISTVSKEFAQDLQLLLINLGIPSKIKKQLRKEKNWRTLYTVTVNGATFMQKFLKLLAPYTQKVFDKKPSARNGFFGWPFNMVERFLYIPHFQRTQARNNPTTSQKSVLFLQQMLSMSQEVDKPDIEFLANCVADKIASITYVNRENVYDLEVEDVHLLSGNGFYTSNSRRGALMLMLWDWHPDIEEFITVKQDLSRINGANLSVCVSDSFMQAVKDDANWDLVFPDLDDKEYDEKWDGILDHWKKLGKKVVVYKTIKARDMWNLICEAAWRSAEPGLVFMERYNKWYNNWYWNTINCVNPCGEEGLPAWGVCNLASLNLSAFVKGYEVDKAGTFDYESLAEHARIAVRFQDNVVDADQYIYKEIEQMQHQGERRIGLGTLGLGDALIKLHLRYGSDEAAKVVDKIYKTIRDSAYDESVNISKEKGSFPKIDKKKHLQGYFIKQLPESIKKKLARYGIRNSMLLQAAPTGTTSLLSGASSGIEPVYEFEFMHNGRLGPQLVYHHMYGEWKEKHPDEKRPDYFVSANDLTPEDHVKVQATIQKYVDASISKTVNAPNAHSVEDVKKLYMLAYDQGCKGVTYMRDGSRQGVLTRIEEKKEEKPEAPQVVVSVTPRVPRPVMLMGTTYSATTPIGKMYVTINHDEKNDPFEVFITNGKSGSDVMAMADALGRMISFVLRIHSNVPARERMREMVSELSGIGGSRSVGFGENRVRSLPDAVAKVLSKHYNFRVNGKREDKVVVSPTGESSANGISNGPSNGYVQGNGVSKNAVLEEAEATQLSLAPVDNASSVSLSSNTSMFDICPECGSGTLAYEEGCQKCYSCGYSAC